MASRCRYGKELAGWGMVSCGCAKGKWRVVLMLIEDVQGLYSSSHICVCLLEEHLRTTLEGNSRSSWSRGLMRHQSGRLCPHWPPNYFAGSSKSSSKSKPSRGRAHAPGKAIMSGSRNAQVDAIGRPEPLQKVLAEDFPEDCLPCRIMGRHLSSP